MNENIKKRAYELYQKGYTYREIANELRIGLGTAWRYVKEYEKKYIYNRDTSEVEMKNDKKNDVHVNMNTDMKMNRDEQDGVNKYISNNIDVHSRNNVNVNKDMNKYIYNNIDVRSSVNTDTNNNVNTDTLSKMNTGMNKSVNRNEMNRDEHVHVHVNNNVDNQFFSTSEVSSIKYIPDYIKEMREYLTKDEDYINQIFNINVGWRKTFDFDISRLYYEKPDLYKKLLRYLDAEKFVKELINVLYKVLKDEDKPLIWKDFKIRIKLSNEEHVINKFKELGYIISVNEAILYDRKDLLFIKGVIKKRSEVYYKIKKYVFRCRNCNNVEYVEAKDELGLLLHLGNTRIKIKEKCRECGSNNVVIDEEETEKTPCCLISLQDDFEEIPYENVNEIICMVEGDLANKANVGDKVIIVGTKHVIWRKDRFVPIIKVNNIIVLQTEYEDIQITEEDIKKIKELAKKDNILELLADSIAPHIYGRKEIKKAIVLSLFGAPSIHIGGKRVRGEIHVLLIGDPSTGKTAILRDVRRYAPRCIYTTGKGSSAAGLTVALVKDEVTGNKWAIEAGACVLADKGVVLIDEFDKMDKKDREALCEAMEDGIISIAKAGIVGTFNARCTIIAAANPKFVRFDRYKPIAEQIDIPSNLLSRFDLIFFIFDKQDEDLINFLHRRYTRPEEFEPKIEPELFKKYVAYARKNIKPKLSDEAAAILDEFYRKLIEKSSNVEDSPIPITPRQYDALVRLTLAHARMKLKEKADEEDARIATELLRKSLMEVGFDPELGTIDIDRIYGMPKTKREKLLTILEIIKEGCKYMTSMHIDEIKKKAIEKGIDENFVEEAIKILKREGVIYEHQPNEYAPTG